MKNVILLIGFLLSIESFSQISLDFQKTGKILPVKLNNSETKYINEGDLEFQNPSQFSLFNLDGSLYKIIPLPVPPDPNATIYHVTCVSTTLFDNDPSNIEFLLNYELPVNPFRKVTVAREDGTILLDEIYASTLSFDPIVYGTEQGTKLVLFYVYPDSLDYVTKVFSLPGDPPVTNDNQIDQLNNNILIFPNPNNGTFSIKINSKIDGTKTINLFGKDGKLIDTYESSTNPTQIINNKIPEGLYFINVPSNKINSTSKLIIKK